MKADDVVVFHMDDSEFSRIKRRSLYTGDLSYPHGHYKSMHSWHSLTTIKPEASERESIEVGAIVLNRTHRLSTFSV